MEGPGIQVKDLNIDVRDWRALWLWQAVRWSVVAVLLIPWVVLYLPAHGVVWAFDWFGDLAGTLHTRCYNRDLAARHVRREMRKTPPAVTPDR
jgi:hypothetical protein